MAVANQRPRALCRSRTCSWVSVSSGRSASATSGRREVGGLLHADAVALELVGLEGEVGLEGTARVGR